MHSGPLVDAGFVVRAKRATYASLGDEASVAPFVPGAKQLEYTEGDLLYRRVTPEEPFRGPRHHGEGDAAYQSESRGDLERFDGRETIALGGEIVYELTYSGGLVA